MEGSIRLRWKGVKNELSGTAPVQRPPPPHGLLSTLRDRQGLQEQFVGHRRQEAADTRPIANSLTRLVDGPGCSV